MRHECYFCHIKTVEKLINKFKPERLVSDLFAQATNELLYKKANHENPVLARDIHRLASSILKNNNLYKEEKNRANQILLENYSVWKKLIEESPHPLFIAAKLAVAGNIIDYGAHSIPDDIETRIKTLLDIELAVDETSKLFAKIHEAESILYLGDNAGEIVFDKLFIETMQHSNITYAVRGLPVINDVTMVDAQQTGLDKICKIISNGYDAPSTLLDFCSEEFIQHFNKADLIIAKGQGNFEGLMNLKQSNIFFMLMAKCKPMAELLDVSKDDMLITQFKRTTDVV